MVYLHTLFKIYFGNEQLSKAVVLKISKTRGFRKILSLHAILVPNKSDSTFVNVCY